MLPHATRPSVLTYCEPPRSGRRVAARWRRHEFRANRLADRCVQDAVDLRLGGRIEPPPAHLVDRLQLAGVASPPQGRRDALVEHPADRQIDDALAEALLREPIEPLHGSEILREARLLEFWIGAAQVVAREFAVCPHPAGEETAAQRAIAERRDLVLEAIGQDVGLDAALEQVIGR